MIHPSRLGEGQGVGPRTSLRGRMSLIMLFGLLACSRVGDKSASAPDELQAGVQAFQAGRYDEAVGHYQKALAQPANSGKMEQANLWNLTGMAWRFKYNAAPSPEVKEKEISAFQKALQIEPSYLVALVNLGATYYYGGRKQEAAVCFEKVLELAPQHPEAAELKKMIEEGEAPAPAAVEDGQPAQRSGD